MMLRERVLCRFSLELQLKSVSHPQKRPVLTKNVDKMESTSNHATDKLSAHSFSTETQAEAKKRFFSREEQRHLKTGANPTLSCLAHTGTIHLHFLQEFSYSLYQMPQEAGGQSSVVMKLVC